MGGALGLIFFAAVYGVSILYPGNIGWLMVGDAGTHFIGWHFFRNEAWHFPLGAIHRYGMEIAASVVYSDSIPVLALVFKPFSKWLPEIFQYTGIWIALCYFLQGFFAWALMRRVSNDSLIQALGVSFFILSPILLFRGGAQHYALMGHWLILAAFVLYLSPSVRGLGWRWGGLALVAVLVHAYLAVMVLAICAADGFRRFLLDRSISAAATLRFTLIVALFVALGMWQGGYFSAAGFVGGHSERYSMNLAAPFMATPGIVGLESIPKEIQFSSFLPLHPFFTWEQYEGFNYLGLGVILLLLPGPYQLWRGYGQFALKPFLPLAGACLLLALYAISHRVTLWDKVLFEVPLPQFLLEFSQIFRSTGRLFWPAYYGIVLATITLVVHRYGRRATIILALALCLQVADLIPVLSHGGIVARGADRPYVSPLRSSFWQEAARHYKRVIVAPAAFTVEDFIPLTFYAASHGMEINIAYYGRPPGEKAQQRQREKMRDFLAGKVDPQALYVIKDPKLLTVVEPFLDRHAAIGKVDDVLVIAPGWFNFTSPPQQIGLRSPENERSFPIVVSGQTVLFNTPDARSFALAGWSWPESWGFWTDGSFALFGATLVGVGDTDVRVTFKAHALAASSRATMKIKVFANGREVAALRFSNGSPEGKLEAIIPAALVRERDGNLLLFFDIQDPVSPGSLGISGDPRLLGMGVEQVKFEFSPDQSK